MDRPRSGTISTVKPVSLACLGSDPRSGGCMAQLQGTASTACTYRTRAECRHFKVVQTPCSFHRRPHQFPDPEGHHEIPHQPGLAQCSDPLRLPAFVNVSVVLRQEPCSRDHLPLHAAMRSCCKSRCGSQPRGISPAAGYAGYCSDLPPSKLGPTSTTNALIGPSQGTQCM